MSTKYTITRYTDWNPVADNFEFKKPSKNSNGGCNINFSYLGSRLYLKTPKMRVPFSIGTNMNGTGNNIQMSFDRDNEPAQTLLGKCEEFDNTIMNIASDNAFDWGITKTKSKKPSREVIEDRYFNMVKYPKYNKSHPKAGEVNPEFPPYLLVKLPRTLGKEADPETGEPAVAAEYKTELYDTNKDLIPLNETNLPKNARCTALIYGNVWSNPTTGFGVSWRAAQLMVYPSGGLQRNKCAIDVDEEDDDEFTAVDQEFDQMENEADEQEEQEEQEEEEEEQAQEDEVEEDGEVEVEEEVQEVTPKRKTTTRKKQ